MSEENTPEVVEAPETDLGDAGKKAIAAERRRADTAEKALKAFQTAADTRANEELTELERLKKENAELVNGKTASDLAALRLEIALEKGLSPTLASRLQGSDRDALAADADSLSELVGATKPALPKADPSQGTKPTGGATAAQQFADAFDF